MTKSEWTLYYRELRKNKKAPSYDNYSSVILRNTYNSLALDYRARVKYNLITRYEGKVSERLKNEIMKSLGAIDQVAIQMSHLPWNKRIDKNPDTD